LAAFEFQLSDLPAQRRLHDRQERGGTGKTAEFRDVPKVLELLKIHQPSL
jgi:hypothetical protein